MLSISAVTPFSGLTDQIYKGPTFGRDKSSTDGSYTDKVSLSDGQTTPELTYQHLAKSSITSGSGDKANTESSAKETQETKEDPDRLSKMMQQVLDAKTGIDRKKMEEIEEKIEALTNKEGELTKAEQVQLELLQKQKEQLLKEAAKKLTEQQS